MKTKAQKPRASAKPTPKSYTAGDCLEWDDEAQTSGFARDPLCRDSENRRPLDFAGKLHFIQRKDGTLFVNVSTMGVAEPEAEALRKRRLWQYPPNDWPDELKAQHREGWPHPLFEVVQAMHSKQASRRDRATIWRVVKEAIAKCDTAPLKTLARAIEALSMDLADTLTEKEKTKYAIQRCAERHRRVPTIAEVQKELARLMNHDVRPDRLNRLLREVGFAWLPDNHKGKGRRFITTRGEAVNDSCMDMHIH